MQSPEAAATEAAATEEVTAVAMVAGTAADMAGDTDLAARISAAGIISADIVAGLRATQSDARTLAAHVSRRDIRILARCATRHSHRAIAMR
jgi:hypothetical protein